MYGYSLLMDQLCDIVVAVLQSSPIRISLLLRHILTKERKKEMK